MMSTQDLSGERLLRTHNVIMYFPNLPVETHVANITLYDVLSCSNYHTGTASPLIAFGMYCTKQNGDTGYLYLIHYSIFSINCIVLYLHW